VLRSAIRSLGESLVRLYYPDLRVIGEPLPAAGPVVFVANHPNGLLDPLVLRMAAGRPVRFLAKSTLFGNPLGKLAMDAFGSVPVYRAQDAQGGTGDRSAANEKTFARCRALLAEGEAIALFPEGTSHSDPSLRPLKTGAARIALSAERGCGAGPGDRPGGAGVPVEGDVPLARAARRGQGVAASGTPGRLRA
jgi:1-acyl-sn-glycerol-3-phosphate acyltransferase